MGLGIQWSNELANDMKNVVDDIWTADLVGMSSLSRSSKGYKYLLMVVGVFSKYALIVPSKTKTGKDVALAFRKLFRVNIAPSRLWTDNALKYTTRS